MGIQRFFLERHHPGTIKFQPPETRGRVDRNCGGQPPVFGVETNHIRQIHIAQSVRPGQKEPPGVEPGTEPVEPSPRICIRASLHQFDFEAVIRARSSEILPNPFSTMAQSNYEIPESTSRMGIHYMPQ